MRHLKHWVWIIMSALLLGSSRTGAADTPVALASAEQVVQKRELQVAAKNCTARREWVEFVGLADAKVTEAINRRTRGEITVGRALKKTDCPDPESGEVYEYLNRVTLTGAWKRFVGIDTVVIFPGGTGRVREKCEVIDLETGRRSDLHQYLTPRGELSVLAEVDRELALAKKEGNVPPQVRVDVTDILLCLKNEGVGVIWRGASATSATWADATLPIKRVRAAFRLPPSMEAAAPR